MRKTTVLKICEYAIFETDSPYPWSIDKLKKSTCGTVYFVSRPEKAEVKEDRYGEYCKNKMEYYDIEHDYYTITEIDILDKESK